LSRARATAKAEVMFFRSPLRSFILFCVSSIVASAIPAGARAACVWKLTGANGAVLYLGGSMHSLLGSDYPLPVAYNRAFDLSTRLVFEDDPKVSPRTIQSFAKSTRYPKNDNLKNHIDPRVYDYLRRVFGLWKVPETELMKVRPWALVLWFVSFGTNPLGIESYLENRAQANKKPITGLESFREHMDIIAGLNDHQAQLVLLQGFIPQASGTEKRKVVMNAWRAGDVDTIDRIMRETYRELPSFYQRLIVDRNRNWIPKIEKLLRSGQTYFVVVGAGHMGGHDGLLALLKARGYQIEQL
jgi:uncharacterized protein YbaP (TraB family)